MNSKSMSRTFTNRVRVSRSPAINVATGLKGSPLVVYESVLMSQIDPVSEFTINRLILESPMNLFEGFVEKDLDVKDGDSIYVHETGKTYFVRNCSVWVGSHKSLVLELTRVYA